MKYKVTWKEYHEAEVVSDNATDAFEAASHYAQENDTRVDEDEYDCRVVGKPDEVERTAAVIRDVLNKWIRRVITISVDNGTATIEDRLVHPVENHSRMHKTVMDASMLDELIRQLGYTRTEEVEPFSKTYFCEGCGNESEGEWCEFEIPITVLNKDKPRFCPISGAKCKWHVGGATTEEVES